MKIVPSTFILLLIVISTPAQTLEFEHLSTRQGLSHSTVYAIAQDHRGFMWIGTREGLNRYDSYDVKTYYTETGLPSNEIHALLSIQDQLYVGTTRGLSKYQAAQDLFVPIDSGESDTGTINEIYESQDGTVFVCSNRGLFRLENGRELQPTLHRQGARSICSFKTNVYWLVLNNQVVLINHLGERIKVYDPVLPDALAGGERNHSMHKIIKDSQGQIWLTTNKGLFTYRAERDQFEYVSLDYRENLIEANMIRTIAEDENHRLWLGTELGLFIYDPERGTTRHYTQSFTQPHSLSDKAIYAIAISREQIAWIGTYFGGINYVKPQKKGFFKLLPSERGRSISGKAVSQMIQDEGGRLWIGTEDGGVTVYDKDQQQYQYLQANPGSTDQLSCNNVHALHQDKRGYVWIGTFLGGLNRYDPQTGQVRIYQKDPTDSQSISNNYVYSIHQDKRGQLWIGCQAGLNIYDYQRDHFTRFRPEVFQNVFVYDILEDRSGAIWFCTRWSGIYRFRPETGALDYFSRAQVAEHGLNCNQIISAFEDSRGYIWFGSLTGGLIRWDPASEIFSAIRQADGLPNDNVYGILEDDQGFLWLTTNKGLSRYEPEAGRFLHFSTADGLSDNQFNFKSFYRDKAGWLYFGTVNGLNYFHPDSTQWNTSASQVYFTKFKLFNKDVPVQPKGTLRQHIDQTDRLVLKYSENVITFEYVGINYFSSGNNHYEYYLEGFESDWNEVANKRTATYTNLSPGDYVFRLRSAGSRAREASSERHLQLTVLPPFWRSKPAFFLYALLAVILIFLYSRFVRFLHRQKLAVQMERLEKEKIREINQHKLNFFTFISHEFKNPLTLIIASVEKFFRSQAPATTRSQELLAIQRNAHRLQHLVQQLMEFRKIESNHASLELRQGDLILFLKDTFDAFQPLFERKTITPQFRSNFAEYHCYFDADKLEMIVTNLLSNAIKHTENPGTVSCWIEIHPDRHHEASSRLVLYISDTGSGIRAADRDKVFTTFYQSDERDLPGPSGSGIGLALVKSLVQYLDGRLELTSRPELGTAVKIELPLYHKPFREEAAGTVDGNKSLVLPTGTLPEGEDSELKEKDGQLPKELCLLLVEDDRELLKFLHKHFSRNYRVVLARNGQEALEKIGKALPDLIVSDAKMPNMDGIALCREIRANPQTNHIPFLLLTAKTNETSKLEGLKVGANAYLTKPFNLKELELLIFNSLSSRRHLQRRFSHLHQSEPQPLPPNNQEREFLHQLTKLVEAKYSDPNFTIAALAQMLGISRSMLHLKMKKIVGLSASAFIRDKRMEQAVRLLDKGHSITEVAYKVGYNDPNYFSKVFKKHFKVLPSAYGATLEMEIPEDTQ